MRTLFVAVLCLLNACCATIPNQYESSKPTTVRLHWMGMGLCSGVATGPHSIATASHCTAAGGLSGKVLVNEVSTDYVVVADDGNDHVILRTKQRQKHHASILQRTLRDGETLYLWGNPDGLPGVLRIGTVGGSDAKSKQCLATLKRPVCVAIYLTGTQLTHGDSGGGFFDHNGNLVGIESGGYTIPDYAFNLPIFYPLQFTPAQLALSRQ